MSKSFVFRVHGLGSGQVNINFSDFRVEAAVLSLV